MNFIKNTLLRVVFSALFSMFGYPDETLSPVFDILHQQHIISEKYKFNSSEDALKLTAYSHG